MSNRAWITLATNDSYGLGALVLASSLRRANSAYPAVVLITPSVTDAMRDRLSAVFAEVVTVNVLDSQDAAHLALLQRPELGITFTKIHCWNLVQYEKCVFLDADTLIVQNCDELFEREELSAAPDVGWPDCFNSGVFVFKPSQETFEKLIKFAQERGSFDGGDQGLLNSFFSDWARGDINKHLPFLYNVTSAAFYSYLPALKHYGQELKIIHFIGASKPWLQRYNWASNTVDAPDHLKQFLQLWWNLFISQVHTQLDASMSGVAGNFARVVPGSLGFQTEAVDELTRRQGWEAGNMDYMGADSFDNIWAKISQTLNQPRASPPRQSSPKEPSPPKQPSPPKEQPPIEETKHETPAPVAVESLAEVSAVAEVPATTDSTASVNAVIPTDVESAPAVLTVPVNEVSKNAENFAASETPIISDTLVASVNVVESPITTDVPSNSEAVTVESSESVNVPQPADAGIVTKVPPSVELPSTTEDVKSSETPASEKSPPATEAISTGEAPVLEQSIPVNEPVNVVKAPALSEFIPAVQEVTAVEIPALLESIPAAHVESAGAVPALSESLPAAQDVSAGEAPTSVESALATDAVNTDGSTATAAESLNVIQAPAAVVTSAPLEAIPLAEPTKTAISEPVPVSKDQPEPLLKEEVKEKTECKSVVEAPKEVPAVTSEKKVKSTATDSPPLAHTPSKEDAPTVPAAQSEERRKPLGKLLLSPPTAADPLPTPDSELEDAASLAQSIIASELRTPTVSSPSPSKAPTSPPHLKQEKRLSVEDPEVPTPPITTPVSLAQIGVKPKGKSSIASRIESSITEPDDVVATATASKATTASSTPSDTTKKPSPKSAEPVIPASTKPAATKTSVTSASEGGKKKLEKKGTKEGATGSEAPVPVPPPRKKEKKPKEK